MKIAVMPGDFVGKEVVAEGLKVLKVASQKFGFKYDTTDYPFGAEHYLKTKITLPDSALKELADHDAILFGAVGADPRGNAQIPQGLIETDILLKMRFELDQYINLRPTRLLPGVPTPLAKIQTGDIDMVIVRENTEGLYCQNGGFLYKGTQHEVANQIEVTTRHGVRARSGMRSNMQNNMAARRSRSSPRPMSYDSRTTSGCALSKKSNPTTPASRRVTITSMPAPCTWSPIQSATT